jgi:colanic acid biosynthesis glycosyl transferase WcaI
VSQRYEGVDFNVPSKLMNFMGYGIPVVAAVRADSEVARIVRSSGGGWVVDSPDPDALSATLALALSEPEERARRGRAALRFAASHFDPEQLAADFESVLDTARRLPA